MALLKIEWVKTLIMFHVPWKRKLKSPLNLKCSFVSLPKSSLSLYVQQLVYFFLFVEVSEIYLCT